MRQLRQQLRLLYFVVYLNRFFQEIVKYIALSSKKIFNFILTSRLSNSINNKYIQYLFIFVRLTNEHEFSLEKQVFFIVSEILIDVYFSDIYDKLSFS